MPRDLFGNVTRPSISIGNRKWYTVPVSLLSHGAIVLAIVGAFLICLFSLLFLLVKETVYQGGDQVTVTSGGRTHTTYVPIAHPSQVHHIRQQVTWLRNAAL